MRIIGPADLDGKLTWSLATAALERGHQLPRASIEDALVSVGRGDLLSRAAAIEGLGFGVKSVTVLPDNPKASPPLPTVQGVFLYFGADDGALTAMIDGALLTKWKTAADSVLAAKWLAKKNPKRLLVVGAGAMAAPLIEAYTDQFPTLDHVEIWARRPDMATQVARQISSGIVRPAEDLEQAAGRADIIATITASATPVLSGDWISPGAHVDLIGAHRPDRREADNGLITKGRLFVDARETTVEHIGELCLPIADGVLSPEDIEGDLYDFLTGSGINRSSDDITVFKNGGGAHLDLMMADLMVRLAS